MKKLKKFVEYQEYPSINGIVYPDGGIQLIQIESDWDAKDKYKYELGDYVSVEQLHWNDCAILFRKKFPSRQIEVLCGEGDYGSDGFVAVISNKNSELLWVAFFECSNPFNNVDVEGSNLLAWSTNDTIWQFPIDSPSDLSIQYK